MNILRNHLKLEEHARNHHFIRPSDAIDLETVMKPETWAHVAPLIRQWDKIAIAPEDGSWYGEFVALQVTDNSVTLTKLLYIDLGASIDLEADDSGVPLGYNVEWAGPAHKWRVVRVVDNKVLTHGLSKVNAISWAINDAKQSRVAA